MYTAWVFDEEKAFKVEEHGTARKALAAARHWVKEQASLHDAGCDEGDVIVSENIVVRGFDLPQPGWAVLWCDTLLASFEYEMKDLATQWAQSLCEVELERLLKHRWE